MEPDDSEKSAPLVFRLAHVPGATPAKWVRTWRERHRDVPLELVAVEAADAERTLLDGGADAAILRPPVDRDLLSLIALYAETPVVVVPKDHLLAALEADEAVPLDDLADEVVLHPLDDVLDWGRAPRPGRPALERPATTAGAVELVAAGVGVLVVPQSLARAHHRKDLTYRTLDGAPEAPVGLAWVTDRTTDLVEEMIGIVRGRTVNSSRGRAAEPPSEGASERAAGKDREKKQPAGRGAGRGAGRPGGTRGGSRGSGARGGPRRSGGGSASGRKGKRR